MSIEELLKPRYKVIADYPSSLFDINSILEVSGDCAGISRMRTGSGIFNKSVYKPEKYPHLFKKLEWWEERKESEMPEYVKRISKDDFVSWHNIQIGEVVKPTRWLQQEGHMYFFSRDNESSQLNYDTGCFQPVTEEEYIQYNKKNNYVNRKT